MGDKAGRLLKLIRRESPSLLYPLGRGCGLRRSGCVALLSWLIVEEVVVADEGLERWMPLSKSLPESKGLLFGKGPVVEEVLPLREGLLSVAVVVYIRGLTIPAGMRAPKGLVIE